jgi:Tfp pilus tip-associated adhesin PilY1
MKILTKNRHLKIFALVALVISSLIYAVVVFNPSTQPPVTIGQYAMQDRDLTLGATKAYRPWFENGAWQGDVIEYDILANGTRTTDALVGSNPPSAPGSNWMARATFADEEAADASYWQSRNIITNNAGQKNFLWDQLSSTQKAMLDPDTVAAAVADPSINSDPYGSDVLNYIRGDHSNERVNDGYLRTRYSLLGDITTSLAYIGPPQELLGKVDGFAEFAATNATRAGRIAAPANDGMLHILDEADGSEVFAYIPSMVIGNLSLLAARDQAYNHTYYLSGELQGGSAQIGDDWHTILTGGGGPGFAGLFALDMTDPTFAGTKILFEKTSSDGFGHIYGKPQIVPLGTDNANPDWYIVTGNGHSTSSSHPTTLKFISTDNFNTVHTVTVSGSLGGLSQPAMLSTDGDDLPDLAFAGDLNGDLWMFEINHTSPGSSTYVKVFDGSPDRPIASAPAIAVHPSEEGYMIYFGTGSVFSLEDAFDDGEYPAGSGNFIKKQAVYGIWVDTSDLTTFKAGLPYTDSTLQTQTLAETSKQFITGGPDGKRTDRSHRAGGQLPLPVPVNLVHPAQGLDGGAAELRRAAAGHALRARRSRAVRQQQPDRPQLRLTDAGGRQLGHVAGLCHRGRWQQHRGLQSERRYHSRRW